MLSEEYIKLKFLLIITYFSHGYYLFFNIVIEIAFDVVFWNFML